MPRQQEYDPSVKGLYSQPNESSGVPPGGVMEARNCVADRPGVLSKRRGFDRYGDQFSSHLSAILEYRERLIALDGSELKYDDGTGTWTSWGEGFGHPDKFHRMRSVEKLKNFYFTSDNGIYKNDSLTNTPRLSGMPEGLDLKVTASGTDGWFLNNTQLEYRMIWVREDGNDNLLLGAPAYKVRIANTQSSGTATNLEYGIGTITEAGHGRSTGDIVSINATNDSYDATNVSVVVKDSDTYTYKLLVAPEELLEEAEAAMAIAFSEIDVEFSVPDGISADTKDSYEIYRTELYQSYPVAIDPGDEQRKVIRKKVTAAEVAAKKVIYTDTAYSSDLGDLRLYTNRTRETMSQANDRAPYCKDIALFKNYLFAANLRFRQQAEIRLNETLAYDQATTNPLMSFGDSLTITTGGVGYTYTLASKESVGDREFLLSTARSTPAANVRETMKSLVRVINRHLADDELYAHYSSFDFDAPGKVLLMARTLNVKRFTVVASSEAFGDMFEEEIPTSGDEIKSSPSELSNGIAYSKVDEPEAFPYSNTFVIGSEKHEIHRIMPLRDSLIILKPDGAYRLSGESAATFVVRDLDRTISFEAANTAVTLNNAVFCLSTQGVVKIDENGTQVISWPIEVAMDRAKGFSGQSKVSFAVGYESERKYILWTPRTGGDPLASKAWVFNYLTNEWTTWDKPASAGIVTEKQDRLYICDEHYKYILRERKTPADRDDLADYMDESIPVTVTSHDTTTDADGNTVSRVLLTAVPAPYDTGWLYWKAVGAGFLFQAISDAGTPDWSDNDGRVNKRGKIASATATLYQLTLVMKENLNLSGALTGASITLPIDSYVRWAPDDGGMRASMKHYTYAMLSMEQDKALTHEMGFYSDVVPVKEWVTDIEVAPPTGWGQGPWGTDPWGDSDIRSTPIVCTVPRQHQRCRAMTLLYRHRTALEKFDIQAKSLTVRGYGGKIVRQTK